MVINKSENRELTSLLEAYTEHCRRSNKLEDEQKKTVEKLEKEIDYLRDQFTKEERWIDQDQLIGLEASGGCLWAGDELAWGVPVKSAFQLAGHCD